MMNNEKVSLSILLFHCSSFIFSNYGNFYKMSSRSIYINNEAIVIAGKTNPTKGTKIEGK